MMAAYSSKRRVPRRHRRVTLRGGETRDVSLSADEIGSATRKRQNEQEEDRRILREIPPHWDVFKEND